MVIFCSVSSKVYHRFPMEVTSSCPIVNSCACHFLVPHACLKSTGPIQCSDIDTYQITKGKDRESKRRSMDRLSSLPEGCISDIVLLTSPRDACRLAAMSRGINSAADSDTVWDKFLPSDYRDILSNSLSPVVYRTKKQLFLHLVHSPILVHDGNMSFGLDKESGKKCYMIGARGLNITWGDTPQYWSWISYPESRFAEAAQLNSVCWLEIQGRIDTRLLSWKTTYVAYLVYKMMQTNSGIDDLQFKVWIRFVWEGLDQDEGDHSIVYLKRSSEYSSEPLNGRLPRNRSDDWKEIELGELFCDDGNDGVVEMKLLGNDGYSWKSGLIVQGIELRPKVDI